jgi:two-component system LytT family response regulator
MFALQAFEAQALDYLLKPFGEERVARALARARTFLEGNSRLRFQEQLTALLSTSPEKPSMRNLMVKDKGRVLLLKPNEIDWIEADGDYVRLHVGQDGYFVRATISHMEAQLGSGAFVRIHRSRLVNLDRVKEIQPFFQGESVVILKTGARLSASQAGLKQLQERCSPTL